MTRTLGVLMVCLGQHLPLADGGRRVAGAAAGSRAGRQGAGGFRGHRSFAHRPCAGRARHRLRERQHDIDIAAQRARALQADDFDAFDFILCADRTILHDARMRKPRTAHGDVELLLEWSGVGRKDVPDPYYGDARDFEKAFKLVDAAALGAVERIRQGRF